MSPGLRFRGTQDQGLRFLGLSPPDSYYRGLNLPSHRHACKRRSACVHNHYLIQAFPFLRVILHAMRSEVTWWNCGWSTETRQWTCDLRQNQACDPTGALWMRFLHARGYGKMHTECDSHALRNGFVRGQYSVKQESFAAYALPRPLAYGNTASIKGTTTLATKPNPLLQNRRFNDQGRT
jgi:hypothetical protein